MIFQLRHGCSGRRKVALQQDNDDDGESKELGDDLLPPLHTRQQTLEHMRVYLTRAGASSAALKQEPAIASERKGHGGLRYPARSKFSTEQSHVFATNDSRLYREYDNFRTARSPAVLSVRKPDWKHGLLVFCAAGLLAVAAALCFGILAPSLGETSSRYTVWRHPLFDRPRTNSACEGGETKLLANLTILHGVHSNSTVSGFTFGQNYSMISIPGALRLYSKEVLDSLLNSPFAARTEAELRESVLLKVAAFGNFTATVQVGLRLTVDIFVWIVNFVDSPVGGPLDPNTFTLYYHDILSLLRSEINCVSNYTVNGTPPSWSQAEMNITSTCLSRPFLCDLRSSVAQISSFIAENHRYVDMECRDERPGEFAEYRTLLLWITLLSTTVGLPAIFASVAAFWRWRFNSAQKEWAETVGEVPELQELPDAERSRFLYSKRRIFRILSDVPDLSGTFTDHAFVLVADPR